MAKSCPTMPAKFTRAMNEVAKEYKASGMSIEDARKASARDLEAFLSASIQVEQEGTGSALGSTTTEDTTAPKVRISEEAMLTTSLQNIFDKLGNEDTIGRARDSTKHTKRLKELMVDMLYPLASTLDSFTLKVFKEESDITRGKFESLTKNISVTIGTNPIMNSLAISAQEAFMHESIHAITATAMRIGDFALRQGIRLLFNLAKKHIKPEMLMGDVVPGSTIEEERKAAQARWDYIFESPNGLDEFVAFGLTNEKFNTLLKAIKVKEQVESDGTLSGAIKAWFMKAVRWISYKTYRIEGDTVDVALNNLVLALTGIKKKNKNLLDAIGVTGEYYRYASSKTVQIMMKGASVGVNLLPESALKKTLQDFPLAAIGTRSKHFMSGIGFVADSIAKHKKWFFYNLISKLPKELIGTPPEDKKFKLGLRHSKGVIDVARHKMKETILKQLRDAFKVPLTDEDEVALYSAWLTTDLDDLLVLANDDSKYDYDKVLQVLEDKAFRESEIKKYSDELIKLYGVDAANKALAQAKGLGLFMVRKETFNKSNQAQNAYLISRLKFDPTAKVPTDWEKGEVLIGRLKTLFALNYVKQSHIDKSVEIYKREYKIPDNNGVMAILSLNANYKKQSLTDLFRNNKALMRAGYTAEIYDPNVQIEFSSKTNDARLLDMEFTEVSKLPSLNHPTQYMYVSNHNGLVTYNKSLVSLTSRQKSGTSLVDIYLNEGLTGTEAHKAAEQETKDIIAGIPSLMKMVNEKEVGSLMPLFNENEEIVGYRYVMNESNRVRLMKKDVRIANVMAGMYEHLTDKVETIPLNSMVVKDLIKDYEELKVKRANDFITVTRKHPHYGEIYSLIPEEMRKELDAYFGPGKLIVRESVMDLVFGYRNYSLTTDGLNSFVTKSIVGIHKVIGYNQGRALTNIRMGEQAWHEFVAEVKSAIVLKTLVLPINVLSNLALSWMYGVPIQYTIRKQGEAIVALKDYTAKYGKLAILRRERNNIGISKARQIEIDGEIKQLEFDTENNPVKPLLDKGMLNSIVEDVSLQEDTYSTRSKLNSWIEGKTSKVPEVLKKAYKWQQISKDTDLYQLLETSTRYSDFTSRYAMYKWLTEEKKIKEEDAIEEVMEAFVEYDPPTSKELQYLNDIGLVMFTKYTLRIQRIIFKVFRDRPDSMIGMYLLQAMTGNVPDITESFGGSINTVFGGMDTLVAPGPNLFMDYVNAVDTYVIPG